MALMALDLPELERPANATSRPSSGGNCSMLATESRKCTCGNWLIVVKSRGSPWTERSVQFAAFQGARKTMIESRFSIKFAAAVLSLGLCVANAFAEEAAPAETVTGSADAGATKA